MAEEKRYNLAAMYIGQYNFINTFSLANFVCM